MEGHDVPDLQRTDERQALRFATEVASDPSPEGEYLRRHPEDHVMEMAQSGERIRGTEDMRKFQEGFPENSGLPDIEIRRVTLGDGLWVVESVVDCGGRRNMPGVAILELRDGKVWRDRRYFAEPSRRQGGGRTSGGEDGRNPGAGALLPRRPYGPGSRSKPSTHSGE